MKKTIFALVAHPDDIEFMMAGTLLRLKDLGCDVHYMTVSNGSCGSTEYGTNDIIRIRREEAMGSAAFMGFTFHESITNDFEIFYSDDLIRRVAAVVRQVRPDIMLLPSMEDYMEDHMTAARLGVTAAFAKGCPNYLTKPAVKDIQMDVALYHAMPSGLHDMMRRPVTPDFCVDVTAVMDRKVKALGFHKSQQTWLESSQGKNEYIEFMRDMCRDVGKMSGKYEYAEGWRLHNHIGYAQTEIDPLRELLG